MLEIFKFHLWLKWIVIYLLCWLVEEIVLRCVLSWLFGSKSEPDALNPRGGQGQEQTVN